MFLNRRSFLFIYFYLNILNELYSKKCTFLAKVHYFEDNRDIIFYNPKILTMTQHCQWYCGENFPISYQNTFPEEFYCTYITVFAIQCYSQYGISHADVVQYHICRIFFNYLRACIRTGNTCIQVQVNNLLHSLVFFHTDLP